jgi:hypothetical protein
MAMHTATAAAPCAGRVFARLARAKGAHRRHVGAQSARVPRRARDSARVSATATAEATADASAESAPDDLANAREVESAEGLRIVRSGTEGSDDAFELEFLLRVKGVDSDVWVPAALVADDVKRDYEAKWWKACREGDFDVVERMLKGGGEALA